jgi:hypothetical protein
MQKNLVKILERILTSTLYSMTVWSEYYVRVYISRLLCSNVGSANLTGAGIGMKTDNRRNFEAGILTDEPEIVEQAMNQFEEVWMGKHCKTCKRREYCSDPIA